MERFLLPGSALRTPLIFRLGSGSKSHSGRTNRERQDLGYLVVTLGGNSIFRVVFPCGQGPQHPGSSTSINRYRRNLGSPSKNTEANSPIGFPTMWVRTLLHPRRSWWSWWESNPRPISPHGASYERNSGGRLLPDLLGTPGYTELLSLAA